MTSELKPCLLCNGGAKLLRRSGVHGKVCPSKWYRERVECKVCGLTTREYKKPNAAVHSWNTRAVPDVPELVRYSVRLDEGRYFGMAEYAGGKYVLHSQAAKIIAAKQADYDAEYNSLVEKHNQAVKTIESWIDTCAELEKRSEDLKADAARYQYLRSRDVETIRKGGVFAGVTPENYVINGIDLDIAIDLAMKADKLDVKGESNV